MPVFESIAEVEEYLKQQMEEALANEVADMVDETVRQHAQSDVYGAYSPMSYSRRGLLAAGNYTHEVSGLSLTVRDETPGSPPSGYGHTPSGTELSEIIETGAQGNGGGHWIDAFARPYMENAQRDVDEKVLEIIQAKLS